MKKYEIMFILSANLDDEARKNEIAKLQGVLESNGLKVSDTKELGVKDLAYPIKKQTKGFYAVFSIEGKADGLNEFTRLAKLDANVIRHLITVNEQE